MNKKLEITFDKPSSQIEDIMWHLHNYGKITSIEAINEYGITRLSDIIYKLRRQGITIISEPKTVKTRHGRDTDISVYRYSRAKTD